MSEFTEKVCGSFEWLCDFEYLKPLFQMLMCEKFKAAEHVRVLEVGCGSSTLAIDLYNEFDSKISVVSIDNDPHCIDYMKRLHSNIPNLTWMVYDMIECADVDGKTEHLVSQSFDVIVDKGSLDAMLVEGCISPMLCEMYRLLKVGGVYFLCSLHPQQLLEPLLSRSPLGLSVDFPLQTTKNNETADLCGLVDSANRHKNIALSTKSVEGVTVNEKAMKETEDDVMRNFFQSDNPLLTNEKKLELKRHYENKGSNPLTLLEAHGVILSLLCNMPFGTPCCELELDYTFDLFKEDLENFHLEDQEHLSFTEIIDFISSMQ